MFFEEINLSKKIVNGKINLVPGGTIDDNKKYVRQKNVNAIVNPVTTKSLELDTALLTIAKEKNVGIMFTLDELIDKKGYTKAKMLHNMKDAAAIVIRAKVPLVLASMAKNKLEMRSPEQLESFGEMLHLTKAQAKWSITEAVDLIKDVKK